MMIEIVSATRLSREDFHAKSALGLSLRRLSRDTRLIPQIAFSNRRGLPDVFNARIAAADDPEILVFMHDDVWIDDFFLSEHLVEGLKIFDVIGVAGNRRRTDDHPAWAFIDDKFTWDESKYLSGRVAHGKNPFGKLSYYGPVPAECELLDGVFLAARKSILKANGILFDPRFDFHLYDMDFCRSARQKGLRLGTWRICLTHQSGGAFGTPAWRERYAEYRRKWHTESPVQAAQ
jgi:GT2 family glycosyltransferase